MIGAKSSSRCSNEITNVRWLFPRKLIEFYRFVIKLGKVLLDEFLERFSKKFLVGNLLEKVAKPK